MQQSQSLARVAALLALASALRAPSALRAQGSPSYTATFHFGPQTIGPAPVLEVGGTTQQSAMQSAQLGSKTNLADATASVSAPPSNELVLTYAAEAPAIALLTPHVLRRGHPPSPNSIGTLEIVTEGGSGGSARPLRMSVTRATVTAIDAAQLEGKNVMRVVVRYDKLTRD
jgi:hypothetical protein